MTRSRLPPTDRAAGRRAAKAVGGRDWRQRLRQLVLQDPLVATRPSLRSLEQVAAHIAPRVVFTGIGLCSTSQLSRALPLDLLGMLLPAIRIRRAIGARSLVVLVADVHALSNGFDPEAVARRTRATVATLARIRSVLGLAANELEVVCASQFHHGDDYRAALAEVPEGDADYFRFEVADILYMNRRHGRILKVGWTIGRTPVGHSRRDEVAFDRRFRDWIGSHVSFVYCKAGRALDSQHPKASPYVAVDPGRRVCLHPAEDVAAKLARAQWCGVRPSARNGVLRHLGAITRTYAQLVDPGLRGPVTYRAQHLVDRLALPRTETTTARAGGVAYRE